jgi:hypothetical protein
MASGMFSVSGSTDKTRAFLQKMQSGDLFSESLESLAQQGVNALAGATPVDSGLTAASWSYEIETTGSTTKITWSNANRVNGVNVAVILQYSHGTGTGGYVAGYDYINPAIQPIFDQIADEVWKKVTLA